MFYIFCIFKKQKCKDNEWKKDKAMQDQKIELYEIQLKELNEREENLRKMNDNLTSALTEISDGKKLSVRKSLFIKFAIFNQE